MDLAPSLLRAGTRRERHPGDQDGHVVTQVVLGEAGDQVLLILDPGLEAEITPQFAPNGASPGA